MKLTNNGTSEFVRPHILTPKLHVSIINIIGNVHQKLQGEFISTESGPVEIHDLHYN